jgi:hypothetical protein
MRLGVSVATALVLIGSTTFARAQTSPSMATAEGLFEEGRRLMSEGKVDEACPKFAESYRLDPGGGTALNVALCHEQQGRTATAWAEFNEALAWAIKDGRESRAKLAREHIATLEPLLRRVAVAPAAQARVPGLEIKIDGVVVGQAAWGVATPLDPGDHIIEATAPEYHPWRSTLTVKQGSGDVKVEVEIPALKRLPPRVEKPSPHPPPTPLAMSPGRRTAAYASIGVGAAGVALGSVFTIMALAKRSDSTSFCPSGDTSCKREGVRLNDLAIQYSWYSTAAFGVGIAGGLAGAYLLLAGSPKKAGAQALVVPILGASTAGVSIQRAF